MKTDKVVLTQEEEIQAAIEKGKKKYKYVYKTIISDETIIWRKLKRGEYKEIMNMTIYKMADGVDEQGNPISEEVIDEDATYDLRQEEIAKAVILYPEKNIVEDMAAVADIISAECMMKSGFGEPHKTEKC